MRNFSAIVSQTFVSYNIGYGEYIHSPNDVFSNAVIAIAHALEIERTVAWRTLDQIAKGEDTEHVTPAESKVLVELYAFYRQVMNLMIHVDTSRPGPAFVYHNLNTGKSVVWIHVTV